MVAVAQAAAVRRRDAGQGVAERTFQNMPSSQAMCFNPFAPLADDTDLATAVLGPFLPGLVRVDAIAIEHTPAADVFGDQTVLDDFRALMREPGTVGLLPLDGFIDRIGEVAGEGSEWARGLRERYARI